MIVLEYEPRFDDLLLTEHEGRLRLQLGAATGPTLVEAIKDLKAGGGDYVLPAKGDNALPIWIWWMLKSER